MPSSVLTVVFTMFLLVFFMMSTMFMVEQKVLPVTLPSASTAELDMHRTFPVTVMADGSLRFHEEAVNLNDLAARIETELRRDRDSRFVLRADRHAAYGQVVDVLNQLRRLGVQRLTVAVEAVP